MAEEDPTDGREILARRDVLSGVAATASMGLLLGSAPTSATAQPAAGDSAGGAVAETEAREDCGGEPEPHRPETPTLGANLNGRPRLLGDNFHLLEASNTTWVRAFLDIRNKLDSGGDPRRDPDVVALRRAAREGDCKLIVSLKWGFKVNWGWDSKESVTVPEPGSERERDLLRCATRYLRGIGAPVDVVVLGNEPMWETKREDITGENPPIVRFTRNVKDHLLRHGDHGDPEYLLGAFNRLYDDSITKGRFSAFCGEMFRMARDDDDIDGIDLHIHYARHGEARKMVRVARDHVPDGTLTVTEFSPARRYDRHVRTPIGEWQTGRQFAGEYGYSPDMTAVDYFERAKGDPRPSGEIADFFEAMPWYRVDSLERNYRLFERFGVSVGTFGFIQDAGMRSADWQRPGWTPFHINFLYQRALMQAPGAHPQYIDDYREMSG